MHEDQLAHLRSFAPEGVVLRQREVLAVDMSAEGNAPCAEPRNGVLQYLRSEIGELKRDRCHRDEAIRVLLDPVREPLVLLVADGPRQPTVVGLVPPEPVDAERLHVHALLVHERDALIEARVVFSLILERRAPDHFAKR